MTFKDINTQYSSWMGNFYKYMSKNQRTKINNLFNELFVNDEDDRDGSYQFSESS